MVSNTPYHVNQVGHIEALERTDTGSRNAQWARANRLIPGIIHGVDADGRDDVELVYVRDTDLRREVGRPSGSVAW